MNQQELSIEAFADQLVDDWRANDGGLTMAAVDIIDTGRRCDRLLYDLQRGIISREEVIHHLNRWTEDTSTGAEGDVIDEALRRV